MEESFKSCETAETSRLSMEAEGEDVPIVPKAEEILPMHKSSVTQDTKQKPLLSTFWVYVSLLLLCMFGVFLVHQNMERNKQNQCLREKIAKISVEIEGFLLT